MIIANFKFQIAYFKAFFILLFCLPAFVNGQKIDLNLTWTNGLESFYPSKINDSVYYFQGGNLHEGYGFCLKLDKNGRLGPYHNENSDTCSNEDFFDQVELKTIHGTRLLFLMNKDGIYNFYRSRYSDENLLSLITVTKVNHELAGKYINPGNGKRITFSPDKQKVTGLTQLTDYIFEDEYDTPSNIITFENKKTFIYEITEKGLDIYTTKRREYEWDRVKKIMSLTKTDWLNTDSLKNVPGKYPFTSKEFLIDGILSCYSSAELAIMRNEIYARHGLIFKSEALKKYFAKQKWYDPKYEKVNDQLTELEKLNIQLIQRYEAKVKEEEAMRKRDGW